MVSKKRYMKGYYKKNKKRLAGIMANWYKENKDKVRIYQRAFQSEKKMVEKYNRPIKNIIREKVVSYLDGCKNILTLESKDFLFAKLIPEKKIYVFEKDEEEFKSMQKSKPKNVITNFGDVSNFADFDMDVDCIYLDFCSAYNTSKETMFLLKEKIQKARIFAVTFCTWDETKEPNGDFQFDLINKLQTLTGVNWKVLFGQGYRDKGHSTMVTIIMENPNV